MKIYVHIMLLTGLLISCNNIGASIKNMEKKYEWLGTLSAPKEYPVEIFDGALISEDFTIRFGSIWGIIGFEWGDDAGIMSVESGPVHLPHELQMTWYSIIEKKFYTGNWPLDKQAIQKVWDEGTIRVHDGSRDEYHTFIVGMAPEGKVVLWAENGTKTIELASFQARDTVLTIQDVGEDLAYFFQPDYQAEILAPQRLFDAELLAKLESNGWPNPQLYNDYERQYNWKFAVRGLEGISVDYFYYNNFNGNRDLFLNNATYNTTSPKTIPKHIYTIWKDKDENEWVAGVKFYYDQVKDIYAQMGADKEFEIVFEIDTIGPKLDIYAVSGNKKIELPGYDKVVAKKK